MTEQLGSLVVVGTGLHVGQMTLESRTQIEAADRVVYLVSDNLTTSFIHSLNKESESLQGYYADGKNRLVSYEEMIAHIVSLVHAGHQVCAVFYGHPGIFVYPSHESVKRLREEGYSARMLPGVSAEDCLFADLAIDPGKLGCQSYEATDFIVYDRIVEPDSYLIIWQIGALGSKTYSSNGIYERLGVDILERKLLGHYSADHEVILYKASTLPFLPHDAQRLTVSELADAPTNGSSTLVVPPCMKKHFDIEIVKELDMEDLIVKRSS